MAIVVVVVVAVVAVETAMCFIVGNLSVEFLAIGADRILDDEICKVFDRTERLRYPSPVALDANVNEL